MDGSRRVRLTVTALLLTLFVAVGLLVRVAEGKRAAEESWNDLYDRAAHAHAGMYVPVYAARSLDGDSVRVGDAGPGVRQLLYFFTTSCPYCRASIGTWGSVAARAQAQALAGVEVYGVGVDSAHLVAAYAEEHGLNYAVVPLTEARWARLFRVSGVPLTLVVEPSGRVSYARRGEFVGRAPADSVLAVLRAPLGPTAEPEAAGAVESIGGEESSG